MHKIMKEKGKQRAISIIMVLAMIITSLQFGVAGSSVTAQAETKTYKVAAMENPTATATVTLPYSEADTFAINGGITISRDSKYTAGTASATTEGSLYTAHWSTDLSTWSSYYQLEFSTKNFENLTFTAKMRRTNSACSTFKIQYSTDGTNYTDLEAGSIAAATTLTSIGTYTLPAELSNLDKAYLRIVQTEAKSNNVRIGSAAIEGTPVDGYIPPEIVEPEPVVPQATTAEDPITTEDVAAVTGGAITIDAAYDKVLSANAEENLVTVIGQVAYVYGNNGTLSTTILQDIVDDGENGKQIVGLQIFADVTNQGYKQGDIIAVTGTLEETAGVLQIDEIAADGGIQYVGNKTAIPAQEITWANVEESKDYYLSEYVVFKNSTVSAVTSSYVGTIKDASGAAITMYRPAYVPTNAAVNDKCDVYGVLSKYNATYQVRTGTTELSYIGTFTGTEPTPEPSPEPNPDTPTSSAIVVDPITAEDVPADAITIDQAYNTADGQSVTVVGQIAYKYGGTSSVNTAIIQDVINDEIIGLQVYNKLDGFEVGDVVAIKGDMTTYAEVKQLQNVDTVSTYKIKTADNIPAQELTIAQLLEGKDQYLSEYVKIKNVTLGTYTTGNTPLTDATGSINVYKSFAYPTGVEAGDVVTVYGAFSKNYTTYQLRNGSSDSYVGSCVMDTTLTVPVAKWAGSAQVTTSTVYGDLEAENDRLDTSAKLTLSTGGIPKYDNTSGGANDHLIGSTGLTEGQYYQMEFSTAKTGNINFTFRMRGSNTGAKYFNVLYSTDGINFTKSDKISYSYTTYDYSTEETTTTTKENVDKLDVTTSYVDYSVTLPKDINNEDKVYIRVQVADGSPSINGKTIGTSGANRFLNLSFTGNPVVADNICGYVKATPAAGTAKMGEEITLTSATEGATIYYSINGSAPSVYDEAAKPVFTEFPATLELYAKKDGIADSLTVKYAYTQEKVATPKLSPNGGAVVAGTEVKISTETQGAEIKYSLDNGATWNNYTQKIKLEENMFPAQIIAKATMSGCLDSEQKNANFTLRTSSDYNVYFGQIHSHTNYSDGAGTSDEAFNYAKNTAENIDFLAITDHSNLFDNDTSAQINNGSASTEWVEGHELADQYTDDTFVGIMGYEMTWSGGAPGHMNTFNTDGFLSRNMTGFGNGSESSLPNYYTQLKTVTDSISQFNHPGTTFGDFYDFGYYDSEVDQLITTIEVGNGEGAVGSSGYFPSYEYYTRALDKGWHVAPTNNQDNHKGRWGDANTGRTVILADSLTRDNIYDALRNMRTYATEDNDLQIQYTLNNSVMGTIFEEKPDDVNISVKLKDPTDSANAKVEVIVNGGLSVASETVNTADAKADFSLSADYSYYYIRVTQGDGDIAVTAPVWISDVESVGISSISTTASLAVKDEPIDITTQLYNNEDQDFIISNIEYSIDDQVIHTVDLAEEPSLAKVSFGQTPSNTFSYTHNGLGSTNIYVTVTGTINGVEKVYKDVLQLNYVDASMVTRVIVDGTHLNDYVNGYYGGNVGNFADIAAGDNVQVSVETTEITAEMLDNCSVLVISAPNRNTKYGDVYHFEDSFIEDVANYAKNGGTVILCGLADYQDSAAGQSSTEINKLLTAMGATTRLNSDEMVDDDENGGQNYRLYFDDHNMNSPYTKGIVEGQTYSAYSGASVLVDADAVAAGKAEALVYGHATTYSIDSKSLDDNYTEVGKGNIVALAHESVGANGGEVFVGGTVFVSNFDVKAELDYAGELTYSNRDILLNILSQNKKKIEATDIATVRKADMGEPFAIEGYVTAGTAVDGNIFFDTIYVQDETGGTTVFPIADPGIEIGQKIRVEGFVDGYQGDKELQVINYELLDGPKKVYEPKDITAVQATDYENFGGLLVRVTGTITEIEIAADDLKYIHVTDASGGDAVVFTDGYILDSTGYTGLINDLSVGMEISAVGLVYTNPDGVVLRVRDRAEIIPTSVGVTVPSAPTTPVQPSVPDKTEHVETEITTKPITAVTEKNGAFYDQSGEKVTNSIVKTDEGDRFILDENGSKLVSSIVSTKNGNQYIVDNTGVVVTGEIVTTNGAKYYTTKNTGKVVTDKVIKVDGVKYVATSTGALASGEMVTMNGNKYYTTKKTGKVVTDKIFKLNGKKYIANKQGKIVCGKWVTFNGTKYYCNKDGVITKTK